MVVLGGWHDGLVDWNEEAMDGFEDFGSLQYDIVKVGVV